MGRPYDQTVCRPQRGSRLPGDCRSERRRHPKPARLTAGAETARRPRAARLRAAKRRSVKLRGPADTDLCGKLHVRSDARDSLVDLSDGDSRRPSKADWMETGATGSGEPPINPRG